ncbi:hypothetical protein VMCG_08860 [Cytospora schulzeri]|uniref:Uncharacterized protein n=1 Tax=Cytospora schulzeri TaxID=448051 RepID=A0A423VUS4_9PEZI|nr:hypothetical protein VMCG_08860 [Valsa malicola]
MAPNILERLQSKLELWRLEQRYTRRRNRRSTFVSNAIYVDGEYIYQTPNTTGSSNSSSATDSVGPSPPSPVHAQTFGPSATTGTMASKERKKLNRFSSMPGFGSMGNRDNTVAPPPQDWRTQRASYDETRR